MLANLQVGRGPAGEGGGGALRGVRVGREGSEVT